MHRADEMRVCKLTLSCQGTSLLTAFGMVLHQGYGVRSDGTEMGEQVVVDSACVRMVGGIINQGCGVRCDAVWIYMD